MADSPLFVLGCPRSGTTMLAALLSDTRYGAPFETHFIAKYYKRLNKYGSLQEWGNFKKLLRDIFHERPVMQMKLKVTASDLYEECQGDFSALVNGICGRRRHDHATALWGDKTPQYILEVGVLRELFPNSKYIFITRDGRDVALSLMAKPWGQRNVFSCAEYWKRCNADLALRRSLVESGWAYEVRYEDLIMNPSEEVGRIYEFLKEEYSPAQAIGWSKSVKRNNGSNWKSALSSSDIEIFERVAGDTLRRFGYEASFPETGIGPMRTTAYVAHEFALKSAHLFMSNTIEAARIRFFGKEPFDE